MNAQIEQCNKTVGMTGFPTPNDGVSDASEHNKTRQTQNLTGFPTPNDGVSDAFGMNMRPDRFNNSKNRSVSQ
jgi:hypothetical protein